MKNNIIVVPAYNEDDILEQNILNLYDYVSSDCDIVISDNNSTDNTAKIGRELAEIPGIEYCFVETKGKGSAVKQAWLYFEGYQRYMFMDADLSADLEYLNAFKKLVESQEDVVIGSRYTEGADVERSLKREIISVSYRTLFHLLFDKSIKDPQCGFKSISKKARDGILPKIKSNGYFFDSELIIRALKEGYSVKEIPVRWKESKKSSLHLIKDSFNILEDMARLKYEMLFDE